MIIIAETHLRTFLSRYLLAKKSGIVIELLQITVYFLSLFATISQLTYVPRARPAIVQKVSHTPVRYASPGSPIRR